MRIGQGFDVHALVPGRRLIIGGVEIPHHTGLLGHSDADVLAHAITDALLGAAGMGDIGRHFPDTDPRYAGADSVALLAQVALLLREHGFAIVNVDVVVIAQRPKIAPHVDAMRARIAETLGITIDRVGIKGKTNETVDATGRGEAIATHAVALVRRTRR